MTDDVDLDLDAFEQRFLESFTDPLNELFLNPDKGGEVYVWNGMTQWSTESAVESLFEDELTDAEKEALSSHLNGVAPDWLSRSELLSSDADESS